MKSIKQAVGALGLVGLLVNTQAGDKLFVTGLGNPSYDLGPETLTCQRLAGGLDGSGDDSSWEEANASPYFWTFRPSTSQSNIKIWVDNRDFHDQIFDTRFNVNANDTNTVDTLSAPLSIKFTFVTKDPNTVYQAHVMQDPAVTASGQGRNFITNFSAGNLTLQLEDIANATHGTEVARVKVWEYDARPRITNVVRNAQSGMTLLSVAGAKTGYSFALESTSDLTQGFMNEPTPAQYTSALTTNTFGDTNSYNLTFTNRTPQTQDPIFYRISAQPR